MERLILAITLAKDIAQASAFMLDREGTCACGRIIRRQDPKFMLANVVPTKTTMIVAAYCFLCATNINDVLKACRMVSYDKKTETVPFNAVIRDVG